MGCNSSFQPFTNSKKINFRKDSNTEIQELPKLVGTYVGLTLPNKSTHAHWYKTHFHILH